MKINRLLLLLSAVIAATLSLTAQNSTVSTYSRFGYGLLNDNVTSTQRAMGGIGYAMNSGRQINVMNPASYAAIDSLTFLFDMGGTFNVVHATDGDISEKKLTGGLDYITMSFPITKYLGASLGILPYSSTGYNFYDNIANGSATLSGTGNINDLYFGLGVTPLNGLYLGANISYLFGTINNTINAYNVTGTYSVFDRYMDVRDVHFDFGVQYSADLSPLSRLTLGLTYSPAKTLHGEYYGLFYDGSLDSKPDTIFGPSGKADLGGYYSLAPTYGAGVNYSWNNRLMVEADFTYQPWKDAKYGSLALFESADFSNRWKVACGAQYTPSPRGSYLGRTQYRVGAYYNHDYLMLRGNEIREIGLTLGLGLPVPQFKTVINLSFEYKDRRATPQALVKEQYFNFTLGVNFNEMWFRKSKIY